MLMKAKTPHPHDVMIGARVRLARTTLGHSQEWLGEKCNITFQQIQKYEKGTNRIGGSRMNQIAAALNRPVGWFFEELPATDAGEPDEITAFLQSADGAKLIQSYRKLQNPAYRAAVLATIATLIKTEQGEA